MGARSAKTARDAKLAMKGLSETRTYRFPQINSSSTLFSDNRKERGVKMRWKRRRGGNRELSEPENFTIAKANRNAEIPFHVQSAKPSHGLK